jgi:cytochrome c2
MHAPCTWRAHCAVVRRGAASAARRKACGKAVYALVGLCCTSLVPAASANDAERGRRLLTQYQCGSCHVIPGVAAATGRSAPTLAAFGRRSYIAGQWPNQGDALVRWIIAPRSLVPDATMPAMGAGEADARDMAAYLQRLR